MIPAYGATLVLERLGVIQWLAQLARPLMSLLGLPGDAAVPLMVGYFLNIYAAVGSMQALHLSAQQITVLAIAILIGHNLLVEGAVLHKAGMNGFAFGALRIVAGLAAAGRRQPAHGAVLTMADLLRTFVTGSLDLLLRVFVIVVPIMVILELFEGTRPFRAVVRAWARVVRHVGLNERSAAPTLIGFLFGLAYGGGVIVRDIRRHDLGRRQVFIMSTFLSMVHAIAEDSLVFIALGASAIWIVGFRILWAALVTLALTAVATLVVRRWRA